jgi:hypothetical protein
VAGGGHAVAVDLLLAGGPEVLGLLDPGQLGALCGAGRPVWFADSAISEHDTPVLWRYLRDEIGLDEITPEAVVARMTAGFLAGQDDRWLARLYHFLAGYPSLWPAAGARPVIRLEDDRQVAALDAEGRPAVYLPGPAPTSLPTVKRAIADSPAARPFLTGLRLTRPDVVAEVLQIVLPRYDGLDLADLPAARHDADSARTRPPASRRCCRRPGCTSAARSSRPTSRATRRRGSPGTGTGRGWSSCGRWASGRRSRSAPASPARPAT